MGNCVLTGMYKDEQPEQVTWCGRNAGKQEWLFQSASHVALNARNRGSVSPCRKCIESIIKALRKELK